MPSPQNEPPKHGDIARTNTRHPHSARSHHNTVTYIPVPGKTSIFTFLSHELLPGGKGALCTMHTSQALSSHSCGLKIGRATGVCGVSVGNASFYSHRWGKTTLAAENVHNRFYTIKKRRDAISCGIASTRGHRVSPRRLTA